MADLGSQKIGSNYKKLLQKDENGMVADGSGSVITLNISGSQYYTSASANDMISAITVTGSIVPEGSGSWDLGSENNPFRDLYITSESIRFVDTTFLVGDSRRVTKFTKLDAEDLLKGEIKQKINEESKVRLVSPISSNIRTTGVEPFVWDSERNLVSNNLTSQHIVSDRFWIWNSNLNELEPRSIMFSYSLHAVDSRPSNDLVIGG